MRARRSALSACALLAIGSAAAGQDLRPSDRRPSLPPPGEAEAGDPLRLPPLREPAPEERLSSGLQVRVERFEVTGSTVFSEEELQAAVAPWTGRAIESEELLAARDAVTRLYVDAGYLTSGAVVPDQEIARGVVRIEVVEGALGEVEVRGLERFRPLYFESRLRRAGRAPVRVQAIEAALQQLQRDPLIERLDAALEPGAQRGLSRLVVVVTERPAWTAALEGANDTSPAVGSAGATAELGLFNFTGLGDGIRGRVQWTEGLLDYGAEVAMPITPWDTRLRFYWRRLEVEIVESPFDELDIESESETWGLELSQPVYRSRNDEVQLALIGELRDLETTLLGLPFCFEPDPGFDETLPSCGSQASVLRTRLSWTRRTRSDVVALRSLLSWGIDAFGADVGGEGDLADGQFVAWLAQAQWAHVLPGWLLDSHLVLRGDLQLASSALFSYERFALGGRTTVRGYRENAVVADNGVIGSGELRIPVWRDPFGAHRLELVPFVDAGHAWNEGEDTLPDDTLVSAGIGLRLRPWDWLLAEVYWGGQLVHVDDPNRVPQDHGFHLRLRIDVP